MSAVATRIAGSRIFQQAAVFTASSIVVSGVGFLVKALLARSLTPAEFGQFSFAVSLLLFIALFFDFGLFLPAARRAALADERMARSFLGTALVLYVPIAIAFTATVLIVSFGVDRWFHVDVATALRVVAPLAFLYPLSYLSITLAQGANRLNASSVSAAAGQLLFLAGVVALLLADRVSIVGVLLVRGAGMLLGTILLFAWLRPLFERATSRVRLLVADAREWGFQVYVGRVLSIGTYQMDVLMLAAYADPQTVGYYALAGALAYAVGLPVTGMATALFPQLAGADELAGRWVAVASGIGIVAVVGALLVAPPLIDAVFTSRYAAAAALVGPLVAAEAVRGVTGVYNSFLSAQGRGRELRNAAVVLTGSNLVFNIALIPPYKAIGAAWASLFALVANLVAHVVGYRRSQRRRGIPPAAA